MYYFPHGLLSNLSFFPRLCGDFLLLRGGSGPAGRPLPRRIGCSAPPPVLRLSFGFSAQLSSTYALCMLGKKRDVCCSHESEVKSLSRV